MDLSLKTGWTCRDRGFPPAQEPSEILASLTSVTPFHFSSLTNISKNWVLSGGCRGDDPSLAARGHEVMQRAGKMWLHQDFPWFWRTVCQKTGPSPASVHRGGDEDVPRGMGRESMCEGQCRCTGAGRSLLPSHGLPGAQPGLPSWKTRNLYF